MRKPELLVILAGVVVCLARFAIAAGPEVHASTASPQTPLDVTITGQSRDEVPLYHQQLPTDMPFPEVIPLSPEEDTRRAIDTPVTYLSTAEQLELFTPFARQAAKAGSLKLVQPPVITLEVPTEVSPIFWTLEVVDQDNKVVGALRGSRFTSPFITWDGFDQDRFVPIVGHTYTPVLSITDEEKQMHRSFGQALQLDAVAYERKGALTIELFNERLFEHASSRFSALSRYALDGVTDLLRRRGAQQAVLTVVEDAGGPALAVARAEAWKKQLMRDLVWEANVLTVSSSPDRSRGFCTEIRVKIP